MIENDWGSAEKSVDQFNKERLKMISQSNNLNWVGLEVLCAHVCGVGQGGGVNKWGQTGMHGTNEAYLGKTHSEAFINRMC